MVGVRIEFFDGKSPRYVLYDVLTPYEAVLSAFRTHFKVKSVSAADEDTSASISWGIFGYETLIKGRNDGEIWFVNKNTVS